MSSTISFADSHFAKIDLIHMHMDKKIVLQGQKLKLSSKQLDGYMQMLDSQTLNLSKDIYSSKKIVASK